MSIELTTDESASIIMNIDLPAGKSLASYTRISAMIYFIKNCRRVYVAAFSTDTGAALNPPAGIAFSSMTTEEPAALKLKLTLAITGAMTSNKMRSGDKFMLLSDIYFLDTDSTEMREEGREITVIHHTESEGMG